jgi:hypothetical protein
MAEKPIREIKQTVSADNALPPLIIDVPTLIAGILMGNIC